MKHLKVWLLLFVPMLGLWACSKNQGTPALGCNLSVTQSLNNGTSTATSLSIAASDLVGTWTSTCQKISPPNSSPATWYDGTCDFGAGSVSAQVAYQFTGTQLITKFTYFSDANCTTQSFLGLFTYDYSFNQDLGSSGGVLLSIGTSRWGYEALSQAATDYLNANPFYVDNNPFTQWELNVPIEYDYDSSNSQAFGLMNIAGSSARSLLIGIDTSNSGVNSYSLVESGLNN